MNLNPIHNNQAEESLLGSCIMGCIQTGSNSIISRINLSPEDFYSTVNQRIYKGMIELNSQNILIDTVTLSEHLKSDFYEISRIASDAVTTETIKEHSRLIKKLSDKRKLQKICLTTLQDLNDGTDEIDNVIGNLNRKIRGVLTDQTGDIVNMVDISKEVLDFIEKRAKKRGSMSGIPSGFKKLDVITDGFQPGDLILLAARPGKGKSALAQGICLNAAKLNYSCGFISLEMGRNQIGIRTFASIANIAQWKLRKGVISDDYKSILKAAGIVAGLPIYFSFSALNIAEIQRTITQMIEMHSVKLIVIDYLQLARNPNAINREREIGEISTYLKHMARVNEIPIIALCQLNREGGKRDKPILADLRDSGQLEQDADVVLFLYDSEHENIINIDIAKGRNIGLGHFELHFDKSKMVFTDVK